MLGSVRKDIGVSLLVAALLGLGAVLRDRYLDEDVSAHYSILEVKRPTHSIAGSAASIPPTRPPLNRTLRLFVKNNTTQAVDLQAIEITGIRSLEGFSATLRPLGERPETATDAISGTSPAAGGVIRFSSLPALSPEQELSLYLWGDFYGLTSVEVRSTRGYARAREAALVVGTERFFATYWRLVLLAGAALLMAAVFFYRIGRDLNGAPKAKT